MKTVISVCLTGAAMLLLGVVLACGKSPDQLANEFGCAWIASDFLEIGAALENRIALKTLALRMDVSEGEAEDAVVYCIALALDLKQAVETATAEAFRETLKRASAAISSSWPGGGELTATPVHSSALGNPDKQRFQELCIKATATVEDLEAKLTPGPKRARESTLAARGIPMTQDNILADRYRGCFLSPTPTPEAQSE